MRSDDDDRPENEPATVVDGDAVELAGEGEATPAVAPVTPAYEPEPYERRAYAATSRSAGAPATGSGWPDPGIDLAEHPEILVGAAFGGGLLLALILRTLGR